MRDHHPTSTSASPTGRVTPAGRKFGPPGKPAAPAAFAVTGLRPLPPGRTPRRPVAGCSPADHRPPFRRGRPVSRLSPRRDRRAAWSALPPLRRRSPRPPGRTPPVPPAGVESPSQPSKARSCAARHARDLRWTGDGKHIRSLRPSSWRWKIDTLPVARVAIEGEPVRSSRPRLRRTVTSEGVFWCLIGSRS